MIKTILVPLDGHGAEDALFATAAAVGHSLGAHIDFYHVRSTPCEAAVRTRHLEYCVDSEVNAALDRLGQQEENVSAGLRRAFDAFCHTNGITSLSAPNAVSHLSATFVEAVDHAESRLCFQALHSDMVLIGRPGKGNLLPYGLIETLLLKSGRPIMIAAERTPPSVTATIVVGWKETAEAARSLGSALPLLKLAERVFLVHVADQDDSSSEGLRALAVNLGRHGIPTQTRRLVERSHPESVLQRIAADLGATLLVVGGYGHNPLRESVFGGVSRSLIECAEIPVFLMH